ncbi:PAS domain S-box protein [Sphingobacterium sp. PCS056]|uniref:PAS domain S-box protein n=1 Tax=Sphingobacterium sp. PCS056 TaxID=2931400 RepID=UPI00200E9AA4|nr:PAS domain S-box protein [Sphingobacterium sp. PCS056]UPZ37993.1 PAS domain S-box protein [Sphingobacterium sp. PCS056]
MKRGTCNGCNYDQTIFDLAPFPMWIYEMETFRFLAVNKEAIRQYGYSESEFMMMTIKDIRPEEDIPKLEIAVKKAKTRTEIYKESLFRHKKRNGDILYVQIKSNLINFRGKKAEIVTAIDLTERYKKEREILAQQYYLKAIGNINKILLKSNDWIRSLSTCFKIIGNTIDIDRIYFFQNNLKNKTTFQRLEWNRNCIESQIDNPMLQSVPLSKFPLFMRPLRKKKHFEAIVDELPPSPTKSILESQDIQSILVLPVWVDEDFYGFIGFDDCKQRKKFSDNEFQLLYALTSNLAHVLKEHKAYQELSFSEGRYKSLIENGRDLVAIIDESGNYKYVAPTSKTVLGIDSEEFLGKNAFDFIYEKDIPRLKRQLAKIQNSNYVSIEPYRFPDANGNLRWIRTELSNHVNTPLIEGIVANTHEVTAEIEQKIVNELVTEITLAVARPNSLVVCLNEALKKLVKLPKIIVSEIWLLAPDSSHLNLVSKACKEISLNAFYQHTLNVTSCNKKECLPGTVWDEKKSIIWKNLSNHKYFVRAEAAKPVKLSTGIGLPIIYADQFLGCIVCFSQDTVDQLSEQINLLTNVSEKLGALVKQKITEEEYRNFFNISPDPHCIVGFDGYIKKCNKAFISLIGYQKKYLYTTSIFDIIHKDDKDKAAKSLISLINRRLTEPFKGRFMTSKGEVKWLLWSATVASESKTIVAVGKDITEQTIAEQELQTAYERLKTAQKIAKLGYWYRDINSDISIWSEETYKIYECSPDTFKPTIENLIRTFQPADRFLIEGNPTMYLIPGEAKSFEHEIMTLSGKMKWVRQEVRLLTNEHGTPVQIEGTIQDITERKGYEKQLYLSNEVFKLAMQASNEMIWDVDLITNQLTRRKDHNQTFDCNLSERFSLDNSWFSAIEPGDRKKVWDSLERSLEDSNEKSWRAEYRVISQDGVISYFVDRCNILRDEKGKAVRLVGAALDVSASRRYIERIKKQNENLREIAWIQSHVIRGPLTRIMALVYLSKELGGGGMSTDEIMELIMESANELDKVIYQITDKTNSINDENAKDTQ